MGTSTPPNDYLDDRNRLSVATERIPVLPRFHTVIPVGTLINELNDNNEPTGASVLYSRVEAWAYVDNFLAGGVNLGAFGTAGRVINYANNGALGLGVIAYNDTLYPNVNSSQPIMAWGGYNVVAHPPILNVNNQYIIGLRIVLTNAVRDYRGIVRETLTSPNLNTLTTLTNSVTIGTTANFTRLNLGLRLRYRLGLVTVTSNVVTFNTNEPDEVILLFRFSTAPILTRTNGATLTLEGVRTADTLTPTSTTELQCFTQSVVDTVGQFRRYPNTYTGVTVSSSGGFQYYANFYDSATIPSSTTVANNVSVFLFSDTIVPALTTAYFDNVRILNGSTTNTTTRPIPFVYNETEFASNGAIKRWFRIGSTGVANSYIPLTINTDNRYHLGVLFTHVADGNITIGPNTINVSKRTGQRVSNLVIYAEYQVGLTVVRSENGILYNSDAFSDGDIHHAVFTFPSNPIITPTNNAVISFYLLRTSQTTTDGGGDVIINMQLGSTTTQTTLIDVNDILGNSTNIYNIDATYRQTFLGQAPYPLYFQLPRLATTVTPTARQLIRIDLGQGLRLDVHDHDVIHEYRGLGTRILVLVANNTLHAWIVTTTTNLTTRQGRTFSFIVQQDAIDDSVGDKGFHNGVLYNGFMFQNYPTRIPRTDNESFIIQELYPSKKKIKQYFNPIFDCQIVMENMYNFELGYWKYIYSRGDAIWVSLVSGAMLSRQEAGVSRNRPTIERPYDFLDFIRFITSNYYDPSYPTRLFESGATITVDMEESDEL